METELKPGQKAPYSGQYKQIEGGKVTKEVTVVKGKTLPPGSKGTTYKLADRTKNKAGMGR